MTTNPTQTLESEIKDILAREFVDDGYVELEQASQDILNLIKQVGEKVIGEEVINTALEGTDEAKEILYQNNLRDKQRHTLDDIISGKEELI